MPDAVFIEDTAVVVDELAIVTRPGAPCRRVETTAVAEALGPYREVRAIQAPGTVDGGDVLVLGKQVFVGRSKRTNKAGIEQLSQLLAPFGYVPLAAPLVLLIALPHLTVNTISTFPNTHNIKFQYSALVTAALAIGAVALLLVVATVARYANLQSDWE